jgi:hypothetical protein
LALVLTLQAPALDLRTYDPARHDRFTGWPGAPVMNPGFLHDATKFTGVGWGTTQGHKQYTLITPRHFVCAGHSPAPLAAPNNVIRFLGFDGATVDRTVISLTPITSDTTGNSDLVIGTLDQALPATVKPLPYLNYATEADYLGKSLMVFGFSVKAGKGSIGAFDTFDFDTTGPNGATRTFTFNYSTVGLNLSGDDCHFFTGGGDSGSPSFVLQGTQPALVGIHGLVASVGSLYANTDTFVPHYAGKVDQVLAAQGYRLRPAIFTPTTLAFSASLALPPYLDAGTAAAVSFTVKNTGPAVAGNLGITLSFPPAMAPTGVSAAGCVVEALAAGQWSIRKAGAAASEEIAVTASWASIPPLAEITASVLLESDSASSSTHSITIPVLQTYGSWAQDLAQPGQADDPDGDGLNNLLEYAFGGAALSGGNFLPDGSPVRPVLMREGGTVTLSFPERKNASLLGISYQIETSENLDSPLWSTTLPAGALTTTSDYEPALPGFVKRVVTWPAEWSSCHARVRVAGPP